MPPEHSDQPSHRPEEDWPDTIDLRRHLLVPLAWWREIILTSVLAAAVSFVMIVVYWIVLPSYTAVSTVVTIPESSELRGLPAFASRQAAMVGLVYHGKVAAAVLERLGGQLSEKERNVSWLISAVSAELAESQNRQNLSDLVRISATADSPEKARAIANAWAERYVLEANLLYNTSLDQREEVEQELSETLDAYRAAQTKLEEHAARNEVNRMNRRIEEKVAEIAAIAAVQRLTQTDLYGRWRVLRGLLIDAQGLREQIEVGGEASVKSNGLAVLLLKASAFAFFTDKPAGWEFVLDDLDAMHANVAVQRADVEALVQALHSQIERVTAAINPPPESRSDNGSVSGLTGNDELVSQRILNLENDLQTLQRIREAAAAEHVLLNSKRGLLRGALTSLERKAAEINIEAASADRRFRLGSPAVVLLTDIKLVIALIIIGGLIGLVGAIFGTFFLDSIEVRPFLARREASQA